MHLGRFNYFVYTLNRYFVRNKISEKYDALINTLANYISSPTAENSKQFRSHVTEFSRSIPDIPPEFNAVTFQQMLDEVNGRAFVGINLVQAVRKITSSKASTPIELKQNLHAFRDQLQTFIANIAALSESMQELSVETDHLEYKKYELGFTASREIVGPTISDVTDELKHIESLHKVIEELLGNSPESPKLRTISGSWWQFFLELDMAQATLFVLAIEKITTLVKTNLEIKKLKKDLEKHDLGDEINNLIDKKIENALKDGIAKIANDIRTENSKNTDEARNNELEIKLKYELLHIAKRINQGASYEFRTGLPSMPTLGREPTPEQTEAYNKKVAIYKQQYAVANNFNLRGETLAGDLEKSSKVELLTNYEMLESPDEEKSNK